ncbi:hypothetical protein [Synechococcus sp. J7-Johnson]|nr:hypothetical protein [Synechococcus sp. J7-Johnson]
MITTWVKAATQLGAELAEPPRQNAFGVETWLLNLEGNRLPLLVS